MPIAGKAAPKPGPKAGAKTAAASPKVGGAPATGKQATVTVEQTILENGTIKGEPITASEIEIKQFNGATANVGVGVQYTRNLGNFESVKINVMVNSPCYVEEVDNMFAQVLDKAKTKLEEAMETLQIAPSADMEGTGDEAAEEGAAEGTEEQAEGGEEGGLTLEDIKGYDEDTLRELANTNPDYGVNPDDYATEEDLRQVIIQSMLGEEVLQEYLGSQDGAGAEEGAEEGADDAAQGYTEEELTKATNKELQEIFTSWELGDFPKGPPPVVKKAAIKKILAAQAG